MTFPADNIALDELALRTDAKQGEMVLDAVHEFLGRFVAYPSAHAHVAHVLWIAHTHRMDLWESTARLAFLSAELASGKTRGLEVTELLVPNPVCAVNVSPAYLFRKVGSDDGLPTILFDEIDTVFGPKAKENEEIRGLLNAGHRRGASVGRCVGKENVPEDFPAYAAVALAGLGWLPDTLLSRSVIIRMRRRHAGEQVEPFRRRIHEPDGTRLRQRIELWARTLPDEIGWPELPAEIKDRDADIWEPLIAVADMVGGDWPERARAAAVSLVSDSKEREPSLGVRLLADLRAVFADEPALFTDDILSRLHALKEAPWNDLKGKPINDRGLATRLRQYGVTSKQIRIGNRSLKGYTRADLHDAWQRYLPSDPKNETSETSETSGAEPVSLVSLVSLLGANGGEDRACAQCHAGDGVLSLHRSGVYLHRECEEFWCAPQRAS